MFSKPRPILDEMPWNIKQDIIDSTDFKTRCVLRKCSKTLRSQVNGSSAFIPQVDFQLDDNIVKLTISENDDVKILVVDYRSEAYGCSVNGKFLFGENHIDRSVADFAAMIRHPRTHIRTVCGEDTDYLELDERRTRDKIAFVGAFEREFSSGRLPAMGLQFDWVRLSQQNQMRMLALTRPGILEFIAFRPIENNQDTSEIIVSEHWKKAKLVQMTWFYRLPAQSLVRFPWFTVAMIDITLEDAKVFVEKIFEFGESFDDWTINQGRLELEAFEYFISEFAHRGININEGTFHTFLKKMPGTRYHLKIEITIDKKNEIDLVFSKVLSAEVDQSD